MKSKADNTVNQKEKPPIPKKEMLWFVIVMLVFTVGMIFMIIYDVSAWWIWYIYFAVWTYIEYRIAKNIHLKWWHWLLIILAIISLDFIIIELVS